MCYDVSFLTKKAKKYALRVGTEEDWEDIQKRLPKAYHASGFDEPQLPVVTAQHPGIVALNWPFIPNVYAPKAADGRPLNTLNARDDKIFTPSSLYFKSAQEQRGIAVLDGFFDHHYHQGTPFPYFVRLANDEPLLVGALWQHFQHENIERTCVTLVTTRANKEMAWLHNEPAYSPVSRMLFVLPDSKAVETWLFGNVHEAKSVIKPLPDHVLTYHPCSAVRTNKKLNRIYPGNVEAIQNPVKYPELDLQQGSLF